MKIIFLDMDGVLNSELTFRNNPTVIDPVDPEMVKQLNRIVKETGARLVLSSTWRKGYLWPSRLADAGIDLNNFVGITPGSDKGFRGDEVNSWLEYANHFLSIEKYAILDDDSDFHEDQKLFKTSWKV